MRTFYDEFCSAGNVVTVRAQGLGYDELAVITRTTVLRWRRSFRLETTR